jgi:hypothetical protein
MIVAQNAARKVTPVGETTTRARGEGVSHMSAIPPTNAVTPRVAVRTAAVAKPSPL